MVCGIVMMMYWHKSKATYKPKDGCVTLSGMVGSTARSTPFAIELFELPTVVPLRISEHVNRQQLHSAVRDSTSHSPKSPHPSQLGSSRCHAQIPVRTAEDCIKRVKVDVFKVPQSAEIVFKVRNQLVLVGVFEASSKQISIH